MHKKEYVGHRVYDGLLVRLLDEIASYRLREELLTFFINELFKISVCDIILVIENYDKFNINSLKQIELFKLLDRNQKRDLASKIKYNLKHGDENKKYDFSKLKEVKFSKDALSYHTFINNLNFLIEFIPASEFKQGGWVAIVHLPSATPRHPERYIILWYKKFSVNKVPDTLSQDERVLYLFSHYYKLASYNIKSKAKLIYEQRMELLKALVPSMISHEIYHRVVTLYHSTKDLIEFSKNIESAETLEEAKEENEEVLDIAEIELQPTIDALSDITGAISKLTKQATTENVNIKEVLKQAILIMNPYSARLGIKLELESIDIQIKTDRALLMHLIMNLITNSIEAFEGLERKKKIINIKVDNTDTKNIYIYVSDNAKGIPPEIADRLFEEGFTTKSDGNGLGLTICNFIAGFLGGKIELTKYKSFKTTFKITLPRDGFKMTTLRGEL